MLSCACRRTALILCCCAVIANAVKLSVHRIIPISFRFHKNNLNKIEYLAGNKVFVMRSILFHKIQLKMLLCRICTCRSFHYNLCASGCSLQCTPLFYCTHFTYSSRTAIFAPKPFNVLLRKSFFWVQSLFHNFGSPAAHFGLKKGCHSF